MNTYTLPFRFVYQNAKGVTTKRELITFTDSENYIKGIQRLDNGLRTFRKAQIQQIFATDEEWNNCPYPEPVAEPPRWEKKKKPANGTPAPTGPELAFTGFSAARRAELEALSLDSGLQVKKGVTKNLAYLCTGANAGPKKIETALAMEVVIMDETAFLWMMETGEIPV